MSATTLVAATTGPAAQPRSARAAVLGRMLVSPAATMSASELQTAAGVTQRDAKKMDRFSLLTLAAVRPLVASLSDAGRRNCGIVVGNAVGGWCFTEPQLRALHAEGVGAVSPYLASAWFPAAPQGQATIHFGLHGFAKTIATDRCAGVQAIAHAASRIAAGRSRLLLAGGAEAPLTPFVRSAIEQHGGNPALLAEAAAFVLLGEDCDGDAIRIEHFVSWPLPRNGVRAGLAARLAQERDELGAVTHVVCCCHPGDEALMLIMRAVVRRTFGTSVPLDFPLRDLGDSLGASSAVATYYALELLAAAPGSALVLTAGWQSAAALLLRRETE